MFCVLWGLVLNLAPGIVAYSLLTILAIAWGYLAIKNVYKVSIHKVRCLLNQLFTILISIMYILLEFVVDDGLGLGYSIAIAVFLILALVNNVGFTILETARARRNSEMLAKINQD